MEVTLWIKADGHAYRRRATLPFAPFPGLGIAGFEVERVLVLQGWKEGIEVELKDVQGTVGLDGWEPMD